MITTILVAAACLGLGYVLGRAHGEGRKAERQMSHWKARLLLDAVEPLTIEGTCTDLTNARPLSSFKFMQPRRGVPVAS